jgi:hypothetical protein
MEFERAIAGCDRDHAGEAEPEGEQIPDRAARDAGGEHDQRHPDRPGMRDDGDGHRCGARLDRQQEHGVRAPEPGEAEQQRQRRRLQQIGKAAPLHEPPRQHHDATRAERNGEQQERRHRAGRHHQRRPARPHQDRDQPEQVAAPRGGVVGRLVGRAGGTFSQAIPLKRIRACAVRRAFVDRPPDSLLWPSRRRCRLPLRSDAGCASPARRLRNPAASAFRSPVPFRRRGASCR